MNEVLSRAVRACDDRVVDVAVHWSDQGGRHADGTGGSGVGTPGTAEEQEDAYLVAAMASAALGAAHARSGFVHGMSLNERKVAVDGAATEAAEKILRSAPFRIRVAAGEGERDDSPGAHSGQWLGLQNETSPKVDAVFDYVDGTELVAENLPGALTLGGFGGDVRAVPDLQAYAVLAPVDLLEDLDLGPSPEASVIPVLDRIAKAVGKTPDSLTVSTHSVASKPMHSTLIELMRGQGSEVLVPERVTVEPPYLLSLIGLSRPRIDTMIGAIGLSELVFAASLIDLIAPDLGFTFRLASIAGPRAEPDLTNLDALFNFSEDEEIALRGAGWDKDRPYTSKDLVRPGTSRASALFAVTDNPALGVSGPRPDEEGVVHVEGFLVKPGARVGRIKLGYRR